MSDTNSLSVDMVILAAGLSERMGVFKPLLPVGGVPTVIRCMDIGRAAGVRDIIIVSGYCADALAGAVTAYASGAEARTSPGAVTAYASGASVQTIRLVHNSRYSEGMYSSVRAGVSALRPGSDSFFLLPSDCCAQAPDSLKSLIRIFGENSCEYIVRPAYQGKRGHPPLIPAKFIKPLLEYSGEHGLKGFLNPLPTITAEMEDPGLLLDMDTPDDYSALLEHIGMPGYPDRAQCEQLLAKFNVSEEITRHGEQVAVLALSLARSLYIKGVPLSLPLLESACLLHDIARSSPDHAREGMNLLLKEGYPKTAILVGSHMDLQSEPDETDDISERELLYLSDKLCRRGRILSPGEREKELESIYPAGSEAHAKAMSRMAAARTILSILGAKYGILDLPDLA